MSELAQVLCLLLWFSGMKQDGNMTKTEIRGPKNQELANQEDQQRVRVAFLSQGTPPLRRAWGLPAHSKEGVKPKRSFKGTQQAQPFKADLLTRSDLLVFPFWSMFMAQKVNLLVAGPLGN